jgi:hypothetical protein
MNATAQPCADFPDRITKLTAPPRTHVTRATWAPELYAWDVLGDEAHSDAGVTDDRVRAVRHVRDALADAAPGATGKVRRVTLSDAGSGDYVELGTEATAHVDAATGALVWTK